VIKSGIHITLQYFIQIGQDVSFQCMHDFVQQTNLPPPTRRSSDMIMKHAQLLQMQCQWYPMGDVITYKSRRDRRRIFKVGGRVDHVTRVCMTTAKTKGQRSKLTCLDGTAT